MSNTTDRIEAAAKELVEKFCPHEAPFTTRLIEGILRKHFAPASPQQTRPIDGEMKEPDPHEPMPGVKLWNIFSDSPTNHKASAFIEVDDRDAACWDCLGQITTDPRQINTERGDGKFPRRVWNPSHLHKLSDLEAFVFKFRADRKAKKEAEAPKAREGEMRWLDRTPADSPDCIPPDLQQFLDGAWRDVPVVSSVSTPERE